MLKVYIADDEEIVRQGLKKIISWSDLGFEICGEANNGLTAYNEIISLVPDLILVDIQMPKLQGLDLASQLREEGFDGHMIVLSGYSEFKYAQEAIRCDVDYYLTKPIDEDELYKAVANIRSLIQKRQLHSEHLNYYQEKAKHKILEDMMKVEGKSLATLDYSMGELNLKADLYQILIIQPLSADIDVYKDLCNSLKVPLRTNSIERLREEHYEVVLLKGELIIGRFLDFRSEHSTDENKYYSIAVGSVVTGINDIYYSYHEALAIHERHFFFEKNIFIAVKGDLPKSEMLSEVITAANSKMSGRQLYETLIIYKRVESQKLIVELKERLVKSKNSAESIKSFLAGMYIYIIQEYKRDYATYNTHFLSNAEIIQWFHNCMYLHEILKFIDDEMARMFQQIGSFNSDSVIDEIIEYMKHHYDEEVKLKTLAPKFGYNSSYLGKIFSKKIGNSFNDYLHQIRTEKSKDLLLNEKYKVYEISELIGYKNVDYFHLKFKQFEGCTPNEYRIANHIHIN